MEETIVRRMLAPHIEFIDTYALQSRTRSELTAGRCLQDIEVHGITSQQRLRERLFVCRGGAITELSPKPRLIRKKTYGTRDSAEEAGDPVTKHLDGAEEWFAIVSTAFVTKPKGPHGTEKRIELYS